MIDEDEDFLSAIANLPDEKDFDDADLPEEDGEEDPDFEGEDDDA